MAQLLPPAISAPHPPLLTQSTSQKRIDHLGNVAIRQPADLVGGCDVKHADRVALVVDRALLAGTLATSPLA